MTDQSASQILLARSSSSNPYFRNRSGASTHNMNTCFAALWSAVLVNTLLIWILPARMEAVLYGVALYLIMVYGMLLFIHSSKKGMIQLEKGRYLYNESLILSPSPIGDQLIYRFELDPDTRYELSISPKAIRHLYLDPQGQQLVIDGDFQVKSSLQADKDLPCWPSLRINLNSLENPQVLSSLTTSSRLSCEVWCMEYE